MNALKYFPSLFEDIFKIIHFQGNRRKFYKRFMAAIMKDTINTISLALPGDTRDTFLMDTKDIDNLFNLQNKAVGYISPEAYTYYLQQVTSRQLLHFLQKIFLSLGEDGKHNIQTHLSQTADMYRKKNSYLSEVKNLF